MSIKEHDPVHEEEGKWYFWDETWGYRYGPYRDEEQARASMKDYASKL